MICRDRFLESEQQLMLLINLTPHKVQNVLTGEVFAEPTNTSLVARVSMEVQEVAPGFFSATYGPVTGLPPQEQGVLLIVSAMVRTSPEGLLRSDLLSPGDLVRDADGNPVGCKGFNVNPGYLDFVNGQASSGL